MRFFVNVKTEKCSFSENANKDFYVVKKKIIKFYNF